MIHCCTFFVTHMMLFKIIYDVMPDNKIDMNVKGMIRLVILMWHLVWNGH